MHAVDIVVISAYLAGSLALGIWSICSSKVTSRGFYLAGRSMPWWPIGMSIFASNIGTGNFVGMAGDAAAAGVAVIIFEWGSVFLILLLAWIFLPVYLAAGIYTIPEYLHRRFGGNRMHVYMSVIPLITSMFVGIPMELYVAALFIAQTLQVNLYVGVAVILGLSVVFTIFGGLKTVILTDALAVVIMLIGGFSISIIGFIKIGGLEELKIKYMLAVPNTTVAYGNTTCGYPREDALHIFRHIWNSDYPWLGANLWTLFGGVWYWCANQVLVQRALAAKNILHAKAGCVFAGYLKLLPMFIMILPGMMSRALYPDEVACADPEVCQKVCGNSVSCTNIALPKITNELLPIGLRGLFVAAMLAAVISSLTSIFNSIATIFAMDIWRKCRPSAGDRELLITGRTFVAVLTGIGILWIPLMATAHQGRIVRYVAITSGYLGGPICGMVLLAIFWPRCNEQGAFWGMIVAQVWGLVRFVVDSIYQGAGCGEEDPRPAFLSQWSGFYHTTSQVFLTFLMAAIISMATKPPSKDKTAGLTFWTRFERPLKDYNKDVDGVIDAENTGFSTPQTQALPSHDKITFGSQEMNLSGRKVLSQEQNNIRLVTFTAKQETNGQVDEQRDSSKSPAAASDEDYSTRMARLQEPKCWKYFMTFNALLLLAVTVSLYGVFG